jgi:hypothetical protein
MMRSLIFFFAVLSLLPCLAQNGQPTEPEWWAEWMRVITAPGAPPELKYARINLPIIIRQGKETERYQLLSEQRSYLRQQRRASTPPAQKWEERGSLIVSTRDGTLLSFSIKRTLPVEQRIVPPDAAGLSEIALAFAHSIYPEQEGVTAVVQSVQVYLIANLFNRAKSPGTVSVEYRFRDIAIRILDLQIDPQGYIISMEVDDLARSNGRNVLKDIPPSLGEHTVREAFYANIAEHPKRQPAPDGTVVITDLRRRLTYEEEQPRISWTGAVSWYAGEPGVSWGYRYGVYTYHEADKRVEPSPPPNARATSMHVDPNQISPPRPPVPRSYYTIPQSLTWMADGRQLWGHAQAQWNEHPFWELAPDSMIVTDVDTGKAAVYRPLVDAIPDIAYQCPSPSPDRRWAAWVMPQGNLIVVSDLARNRLFIAGGNSWIAASSGTRQVFHIAWRSDSTGFVYPDDKRICIVEAAEFDGIPFAASPRKYVIGEKLLAVEYLPGSRDECVASVRSGTFDGAKLVHLKLQADDTAVVTTLFEDAKWREEIVRLQILPDGRRILFSRSSSLYLFDMDTKQVVPLTWINRGLSLDNKPMYIDGKENWRVSPDGRRIAFTAHFLNEAPAAVLCVADLDGANLHVLPSEENQEPFPRYRPNGKDAVVPLDNLPMRILSRVYHVPFPTKVTP